MTKGIYALRPELAPRVWVCYDVGKALTLKDEFLRDACSSCGRVPPSKVFTKNSLRIDGLNSFTFPALRTEDNHVLYSSRFVDAIRQSAVGGLSFLKVNKGEYSIGWTSEFVAVDDSQMKRPRGNCQDCGHPITAFGPVRLLEKPVNRLLYGLSVEHDTGHSGYRHIVCNQAVYDDLSALGFEDCFQAIETIALLGGSWKRPPD